VHHRSTTADAPDCLITHGLPAHQPARPTPRGLCFCCTANAHASHPVTATSQQRATVATANRPPRHSRRPCRGASPKEIHAQSQKRPATHAASRPCPHHRLHSMQQKETSLQRPPFPCLPCVWRLHAQTGPAPLLLATSGPVRALRLLPPDHPPRPRYGDFCWKENPYWDLPACVGTSLHDRRHAP